MMRKSLSDILHGDQSRLQDAWDHTKAADDYGTPLPAAEYTCHLIACDPFNARQKSTPGVKLAFKIIEGEHAGRQVWHDCWLTEAALPQTKRDLAKLGVTELEQLERPLPPGIRCVVKLSLRKDDDGTEYNRVKTFAVVGIDEPEVDAFAPADAPSPPAPLPTGEGSISPEPLAAANVAGGTSDDF